MRDYLELGGTLFVPAVHKNLKEIVNGEKYPSLRSVVIDTEDAIDDKELSVALESVRKVLKDIIKTDLLVFVRPRSVELLDEILAFESIEKIDGFIFPKFSLENADNYLEAVENQEFYIMPSIEGSELFDANKLIELREKLLKHKEKILLVRFGLEDMLRQLGLRRGCEDSIFDFAVTNTVLGNFIAVFKSVGFGISGGVYPCFKDIDGFKKDVQRDLKEGLFSKTIIHPSQIDIINELYKVDESEVAKAKAILESKKAVFNQSGMMAEQTTMSPYSNIILRRAKIYGKK